MKRRVAALFALGIPFLAMLSWSIWLLVTGPLGHLLHSRAETYYGAFTILLICIAVVTGLLVGAWDSAKAAPRTHRHIPFRALFHH